MYQISELVVYGSIGVCRVNAITCPDPDSSKQFYELAPLYQSGVIYTPIEPGRIPMRPVMSRDDAMALLDRIPTVHAEIYRERTLQLLAQRYQSTLQTADPLQLLSLTMSVYRKRRQAEAQNRRLGMVDERFGRQAERLLYGELAIALDIPVDDVPAYIGSHVPESVLV